MKYKTRALLIALVISQPIAAAPSLAGYLDELETIKGAMTERTPLNVLFYNFAIGYFSCAAKFQLADAHREGTKAQAAFDEGRACQAEPPLETVASIAKLKIELTKPGAQSALKEMVLYAQFSIAELQSTHSELDGVIFLRALNARFERVKLEADW